MSYISSTYAFCLWTCPLGLHVCGPVIPTNAWLALKTLLCLAHTTVQIDLPAQHPQVDNIILSFNRGLLSMAFQWSFILENIH